jgi:uncharacterized protein YggU (UPF0235/DUF167 family)
MVHLTPRAGRDSIDGWDGDVLRVRVAAAPADGRANDALRRTVAAALAIAPSRVGIVSGATSRRKLLAIQGLSLEEVHRTLG